MRVVGPYERPAPTLGELLQQCRIALVDRPFLRLCTPLGPDDGGAVGALEEPLIALVPDEVVVLGRVATREQVQGAIEDIGDRWPFDLWQVIDEECSLRPLQRLLEESMRQREGRTKPPAPHRGHDLAA